MLLECLDLIDAEINTNPVYIVKDEWLYKRDHIPDNAVKIKGVDPKLMN